MKKKEKQSLRGMSEVELAQHISVLEAEIAKGKLDQKTKQMKNIRILRSKRVVVAIAKTILRERMLST